MAAKFCNDLTYLIVINLISSRCIAIAAILPETVHGIDERARLKRFKFGDTPGVGQHCVIVHDFTAPLFQVVGCKAPPPLENAFRSIEFVLTW
jgi:hypothetical protein